MYCSVDVLDNFLENHPMKSLKLDDLFELEEHINKFCKYSEEIQANIDNIEGMFNGTYSAMNLFNKDIQESLGLFALYSPTVVLIDNIYSWFSYSKMNIINLLPENDSHAHMDLPEKRSFRQLVMDNSLSNDDKLIIARNFLSKHYEFLKSIQKYIHNNQIVMLPYYDLLENTINDIKIVSDEFEKSEIYLNIYSKVDDDKFENSDEIAHMSAMFNGYAKGVKPGDKAKIVEFKKQRTFYEVKNLFLSKKLGVNYCPSSDGNSLLNMGLNKYLVGKINNELNTQLSVTKLLLYGDLPFFHNGTLLDALRIRENAEGFNEWRNELVKTIHTYNIDFNSKKEVKSIGNEIFMPTVKRIQNEIDKSRALSSYFSTNDLFAFAGGFISRYYFSSNDIKQNLAVGGISSVATIAAKILTGYGRPKLKGMDNFIYNILRYKK